MTEPSDARSVGVVVLAHNRPQHLDLVLSGLSDQDVGPECFAVIVVDNGSATPLDETVDQYRSKLNVECLRLDPAVSRSAARNHGLAAVREATTIFLDGDTVPSPGLVRVHLESLQDPRVVMSLGRRDEIRIPDVGGVPPGAPGSVYGDLLRGARRDIRLPDVEDPLIQDRFRQIGYFFTYTHNVAVRTDVARAAGGFNEDLIGYGLEDLEFGFRVRRAAGPERTVVWSPSAGSVHVPHLRKFAANSGDMAVNQSVLLESYRSFHWEGHRYASPHLECLRILLLEALAEAALRAGPVADLPPEAREWMGDPAARSFVVSAGPLPATSGAEAQLRSEISSWRDPGRWSLCGTQLPFAPDELDRVVNVDVWRVMPWHHVSEIIAEGLRVGPEVILVATSGFDEVLDELEPGTQGARQHADEVLWIAEAARDVGYRAELHSSGGAVLVRVA